MLEEALALIAKQENFKMSRDKVDVCLVQKENGVLILVPRPPNNAHHAILENIFRVKVPSLQVAVLTALPGKRQMYVVRTVDQFV